MRWPIEMAKMLGDTSAKYRWFSVIYLIGMFFFLPLAILGLSIVCGKEMFTTIGGLLLFVLVFIILVNVLQSHKPNLLPKWLKNWNVLPLWMRSLEPLDKRIKYITDKISNIRGFHFYSYNLKEKNQKKYSNKKDNDIAT